MRGGKREFSISRDKVGLASNTVLYPIILNANQWYHVTYLYNSANTTLALFLDGVPVAQATGTTGNGNNGGRGTFASGFFAHNTGNIQAMNGRVAGVAVYKAALSSSSIKNLYTRRPPDNDPNLVLLMPMDEVTGTSTFDRARSKFKGNTTTTIKQFDHPYVSW